MQVSSTRIKEGAGERPAKRILLAEDNPADVYLIQEALRGAPEAPDGIEIVAFSDGEQAIDYVLGRGEHKHAPRPHLIVLDLNLPKNDGWDILRCIRNTPEYEGIPVVILTSSDSPADRSLIEQLGADQFLTKPSDLDEFMSLGRVLLKFAEE